jgi:hypothetical protein
MTEHTAAEILYAQLDHDVAQAKWKVNDRLYNGPPFQRADEIESLCELVCKRWWIGRMTAKHPPPVDVTSLHDRMNHRTNAIIQMTQNMIDKAGPIDPTALQMQLLGMSAEVNALWGCLIEAGLMTPQNRQDYMDAAVAMLYKRVFENPKIIMPEMSDRAS